MRPKRRPKRTRTGRSKMIMGSQCHEKFRERWRCRRAGFTLSASVPRQILCRVHDQIHTFWRAGTAKSSRSHYLHGKVTLQQAQFTLLFTLFWRAPRRLCQPHSSQLEVRTSSRSVVAQYIYGIHIWFSPFPPSLRY